MLSCVRTPVLSQKQGWAKSLDRKAAQTTRSLIFFHHHQRDVVSLRHALSECFNGLQKAPLQRLASHGRLAPDDFQQSLLAEHLRFPVFSIRETIGIHYQDVSLVEVDRSGAVSGEIEH